MKVEKERITAMAAPAPMSKEGKVISVAPDVPEMQETNTIMSSSVPKMTTNKKLTKGLVSGVWWLLFTTALVLLCSLLTLLSTPLSLRSAILLSGPVWFAGRR